MCTYVYVYIHTYVCRCFLKYFGRIRVVAVGRGRVMVYKEVGDIEERTKRKQVIESSSVQSSNVNVYIHPYIST